MKYTYPVVNRFKGCLPVMKSDIKECPIEGDWEPMKPIIGVYSKPLPPFEPIKIVLPTE